MANEKQTIVRLRNGAVVDAQHAYGEWLALRAELRVYPANVEALFNLVSGRKQPSNIAPGVLKDLRQLGYFRKEEVDPLIASIIESAYRETPDGATLISPFKVGSEDERIAAEAAERRAGENLRANMLPPDEPGWSR